MKKTTLIIFLILFLLSAGSGQFQASDRKTSARCAVPLFEAAFEKAGAVFVGTVLSKKTDGQMKIFELEVIRFWKGVDSTTMTIHVNENPRFQAQFEVGETYLVFAEADDDGRLFDRRCSRTKILVENVDDSFDDGVREDLQKLGEGDRCISLG